MATTSTSTSKSTEPEDSKTSDVKDEIQAQPASYEVVLDEFCARLSKTDKRIELIAGFYAEEIRAKRIKDSASAYQARFSEFTKLPVKD